MRWRAVDVASGGSVGCGGEWKGRDGGLSAVARAGDGLLAWCVQALAK